MSKLLGFDKRSIAKARGRGKQSQVNDAILLSFLPSTNQIHLELRNNTEVRIPVQAISGLRELSRRDLSRMKLSKIGDAIELSERDVHVSVSGIVRKAIFGDDFYAKAGRVKSKAKAVAARANGKKGGRPKRRALEVA